jgi:c-di-GMP-binding flagellar brake protein YcgR
MAQQSYKGYKRAYYRLKPRNVLYSRMTISKIGLKPVKTRHTRVRLIDVSPGGLKFTSSLKFPVSSEVVLEFSICTIEDCLFLQGHIVYRNEKNRGTYIYGVCFDNIDKVTHKLLVRILNSMKANMRYYIFWG